MSSRRSCPSSVMIRMCRSATTRGRVCRRGCGRCRCGEAGCCVALVGVYLRCTTVSAPRTVLHKPYGRGADLVHALADRGRPATGAAGSQRQHDRGPDWPQAPGWYRPSSLRRPDRDHRKPEGSAGRGVTPASVPASDRRRSIQYRACSILSPWLQCGLSQQPSSTPEPPPAVLPGAIPSGCTLEASYATPG